MIKIVQTSQVKSKFHVATRDLEHTAKIPTKPMPCGKKTAASDRDKGVKGEK